MGDPSSPRLSAASAAGSAESEPTSAATGADYAAALERLNRELDSDRLVDRRFGMARLAAFLTMVSLWLVGYGSDGLTLAGHAGWAFGAAFLGLVVANEPIKIRLAGGKLRREVLQRLALRVARDWKGLERIGDAVDPMANLDSNRISVASDLDLVGKSSLLRMLSTTGTRQGLLALTDWITGPADPVRARGRAAWSRGLVGQREDRIGFYEAARVAQSGESTPESLASWAAGDRWLEKRGGVYLKWSVVSIALTACFIACIALGLATDSASRLTSIGLLGVLAIAAINLVISMFALGPMHEAFAIAIGHRQTLAEYQSLFELAGRLLPGADACSEDPSLKRISEVLSDGPESAFAGIAGLAGVSRMGLPRQSAALFLFYIPLQLLGLYDLWVLRKLEAWQRLFGDHVTAWFEVLGQTEAAAAIAALRDENPEWTEPVWADAKENCKLETVGLGHPLLADDVRVPNDVSVGPPQTFLLVTGSNMSGKSTMLRSVGLNVALAAAGAPVCAKSMRLPAIEMATSIRVRDDLADGVSFYMAELHRLREVVDQSQALAEREDRVCLFLLDEILQGTNSRERQIAVAQVLRRLMSHGSIGAITTHDLELADDETVSKTAIPVHFREIIESDADGRETMKFDYQMRQGVCPTTNALKLMELIGL